MNTENFIEIIKQVIIGQFLKLKCNLTTNLFICKLYISIVLQCKQLFKYIFFYNNMNNFFPIILLINIIQYNEIKIFTK